MDKRIVNIKMEHVGETGRRAVVRDKHRHRLAITETVELEHGAKVYQQALDICRERGWEVARAKPATEQLAASA